MWNFIKYLTCFLSVLIQPLNSKAISGGEKVNITIECTINGLHFCKTYTNEKINAQDVKSIKFETLMTVDKSAGKNIWPGHKPNGSTIYTDDLTLENIFDEQPYIINIERFHHQPSGHKKVQYCRGFNNTMQILAFFNGFQQGKSQHLNLDFSNLKKFKLGLNIQITTNEETIVEKLEDTVEVVAIDCPIYVKTLPPTTTTPKTTETLENVIILISFNNEPHKCYKLNRTTLINGVLKTNLYTVNYINKNSNYTMADIIVPETYQILENSNFSSELNACTDLRNTDHRMDLENVSRVDTKVLVIANSKYLVQEIVSSSIELIEIRDIHLDTSLSKNGTNTRLFNITIALPTPMLKSYNIQFNINLGNYSTTLSHSLKSISQVTTINISVTLNQLGNTTRSLGVYPLMPMEMIIKDESRINKTLKSGIITLGAMINELAINYSIPFSDVKYEDVEIDFTLNWKTKLGEEKEQTLNPIRFTNDTVNWYKAFARQLPKDCIIIFPEGANGTQKVGGCHAPEPMVYNISIQFTLGNYTENIEYSFKEFEITNANLTTLMTKIIENIGNFSELVLQSKIYPATEIKPPNKNYTKDETQENTNQLGYGKKIIKELIMDINFKNTKKHFEKVLLIDSSPCDINVGFSIAVLTKEGKNKTWPVKNITFGNGTYKWYKAFASKDCIIVDVPNEADDDYKTNGCLIPEPLMNNISINLTIGKYNDEITFPFNTTYEITSIILDTTMTKMIGNVTNFHETVLQSNIYPTTEFDAIQKDNITDSENATQFGLGWLNLNITYNNYSSMISPSIVLNDSDSQDVIIGLYLIVQTKDGANMRFPVKNISFSNDTARWYKAFMPKLAKDCILVLKGADDDLKLNGCHAIDFHPNMTTSMKEYFKYQVIKNDSSDTEIILSPIHKCPNGQVATYIIETNDKEPFLELNSQIYKSPENALRIKFHCTNDTKSMPESGGQSETVTDKDLAPRL